jgi:hypothetical protein
VALAAGDRFCVECSASAMVCPACGEPVEPGNCFAGPAVRRWLVSGPDQRQLGPPRGGGPERGGGLVAERRVCSGVVL